VRSSAAWMLAVTRDLRLEHRHVDGRRRLARQQERGDGYGGEEDRGAGDPPRPQRPPAGQMDRVAAGAPEPRGLEIREDAGGRPAIPRLLAQAVGDDPFQNGGRVRPGFAQRRRLLVKDGVHHSRALAAEGLPAREHLVEHHAQRPEIGGGARALPLELLGRHVGGGPHRRPFLGEGLGVEPAGEAEVEQLHPSVRQHHDVFRLEVPVDDAGGVGGCERRGELASDGGRRGHGQAPVRLAGQELGQGRALVEGHGQKTLAFVLADLVDGADVRVVEGGGGLGLAAEADLVGRTHGAPVMEKLDRHLAAQLDVHGEVDHAHAAAAKGPEQPIVGDLPAREGLPGRGGSLRRDVEHRGAGGISGGGDGKRGAAGQTAAVELRVGSAAGGAKERLHQPASGRPARSPRAERWRASSFCR